MWAWLIPLIAGAVGAIGSKFKGDQASSQYDAFAAANDYNAAVLRQRADAAHTLSGGKEAAYRRTASIALGNQRAAVAQSGAGSEGSNLDIERQSEVMKELDALNITYGDDLEAKGYQSQAVQEEYQARVNRWAGKQAGKMGFLGAAGSLLSGAGQSMGASGYGQQSYRSGGYTRGGGLAPSDYTG